MAMSAEFFDCLQHKHAYVALAEFKPGRFADAQRLYEKAISTYKDGFKGAFLLRKPNSEEGIAVILWKTLEDMEANQTDVHRKILEEMGPLFNAPPVTNVYEVCSEVGAYGRELQPVG
jgi:heme-degrading monooxygenase HmoA